MARPQTIQLRETKTACPPGAVIIDVDFSVVRESKRAKRKRSWFFLLVLTVFAAAAGGMAGFFAPAALAEAWSVFSG